jgi:DNA-binding GntR family transcriptional regulator
MSAVPEPEQLNRISTVDALAESLRARILEGDLAAGERLRERELTESYGVARHSLRAALRALEAEGLVRVEPNRGASVATLSVDQIVGLYELRAALEVEAARLALERGAGTLPDAVNAAVVHLSEVCRRQDPPWIDVADAHAGVHTAIVAAAGSERIARAHAALDSELQLFLVQLRPHWSLARMAKDHRRLVRDLEGNGPEALRDHLRESMEEVTAAAARVPTDG